MYDNLSSLLTYNGYEQLTSIQNRGWALAQTVQQLQSMNTAFLIFFRF